MQENPEFTPDELLNNFEKFKELLLTTKREGIKDLIDYLDKSDFFVSPVSTQFHHSYIGGLVIHSIEVYRNAVALNESMKFSIDDDSLKIACLLHNLDKIDSFSMEKRNKKDEKGKWIQVDYFYKDETFPIGNSEKSVIIAQKYINLTDQEIAMIIGSTGTFNNKEVQYMKLVEKFPEVILIHTADMLSTTNTYIF